MFAFCGILSGPSLFAKYPFKVSSQQRVVLFCSGPFKNGRVRTDMYLRNLSVSFNSNIFTTLNKGTIFLLNLPILAATFVVR